MNENMEERNQRSKGYARFRSGFDYAMGIIYIACGVMVIFARRFGIDLNLSSTVLALLGVLLVAYGLFRLYRGWKHIF